MAEPNGDLKKLLKEDFKHVAGLSAADQARLVNLFEAARQKQNQQLREAQEHALRFVPALLRKPLLKLLSE